MLKLFLTCIGISISSLLLAQICSTPQEPLLERVDLHKKSLIQVQRGVLKYIPVTFHMVADASGNGRVTEEAVLDQLANLNEQYGDQETKFYIDRLNYFDHDPVYNTPYTNAAKTQMRLRKDNNSVNVYITNSADDGTSPGMTLAYYDPNDDWIVSRKASISGSTKVLAHEVGHFFSLPHPHVGWDCFPYTLTDYTNPVNVDFTIPCETGGGSALIELHDRSNCNLAGDRICDTPEDYNLGLLYSPNTCGPNTTIKDKNGEIITPMENNYMSYYFECDSFEFSPTQKNLINTDFYSIQRQYLRTGHVPNTDDVEAPVQYISPINGQESNGVTNILLDWEDTPGANKYLVIYSRFPNFTSNPVKAIVSNSQYTITNVLLEGVTYYWKVWPYNECMTGSGYSPSQNFKVGTGTAVNEIKDITEYSITPNPASNDLPSFLNLSSIKSFSARFELMNGSGQVIMKENIEVNSGLSQHPIQTDDLPAGIYFVTLVSEQGRLVERLLILN